MSRSGVLRLLMLVIVAFASWTAACAHSAVASTAFVRKPQNCDTTTIGNGRIPDVTNGYDKIGCVYYLATKAQTPNPKGPIDQWISAKGCNTDPAHPDAIEVLTTTYHTAGSLTDAEYQAHNGFIIAKVENLSDCTPSPSGKNRIRLQALTTYYLVIHGNANQAMLIASGAPTIPLQFASCTTLGHAPNPNGVPVGDTTFFKDDPNDGNKSLCDHDPNPHFTYDHSAASFVNVNSLPLPPAARRLDIGEDSAIWFACGADCCVAQ